jgi:hypothetical protein
MTKQTTKKKLALETRTLRDLTLADARTVVGGMRPNTMFITCPCPF